MMQLLYILIPTIILISIAFLQEIQYRRNLFSHEVLQLKVALPIESPTCEYESRYFRTQLTSCDSLVEHHAVSIIGRVDGASDGNIFHKKRLIIESIEPYSMELSSLKDWKLLASHWVLVSRQTLFSFLREKIPPQEAGLAIALVFGNTQWLSKHVKPYFENTGTLHILAASGQNVSLVLMMIQKLMPTHLALKIKGVLLLVIILIYVLLVGEQPSFIRAACMAVLFLFSRYYLQKQYVALYGLAVTCITLLIFRPEWSVAIGFWLSIFATMGIIVCFLKIQDMVMVILSINPSKYSTINSIKSNSMGLYIIESVSAGMAAQLATVPIVLTQFGSVQLLSFIPTTIVSWLIPSIIMFTMGGAVLGTIESTFPMLKLVINTWMLISVYLPVHAFTQLLNILSQLSWGIVTNPWYEAS